MLPSSNRITLSLKLPLKWLNMVLSVIDKQPSMISFLHCTLRQAVVKGVNLIIATYRSQVLSRRQWSLADIVDYGNVVVTRGQLDTTRRETPTLSSGEGHSSAPAPVRCRFQFFLHSL